VDPVSNPEFWYQALTSCILRFDEEVLTVHFLQVRALLTHSKGNASKEFSAYETFFIH